jgi:hypothetical protein
MTPVRPLTDMDPDEREFVEEFSRPIEALGARMASCPPFDRVIASREGVLPEPEQAAVAGHVDRCAVCQALLRDALASDIEFTAADLSRGRARALAGQPPRPARNAPNRVWMLAVAASLAAVVMTGLWARSLRQENRALRTAAAATDAAVAGQLADARVRTEALEREVARLAQPSVALNVPLIDLEPIGALRSGTSPAVAISRAAPLVTLVLAVTGTPARDGYTLDIRDSMDRVTWTGQGLVATSIGTVTLAVPRALLPAGDLTLRLSAAGGTLVQRYAVRIEEVP